MKNSNSFSILFWINKAKADSNVYVPLFWSYICSYAIDFKLHKVVCLSDIFLFLLYYSYFNLMYKFSKPAIFIFLLCACIACKKNSNDEGQISILGKWNLQKVTMAQYVNGQLLPEPTLLPETNSILFNANNTFTDIYYSAAATDTTQGQYSLSGKTIVFSNYQSKYSGGPFGVIRPSPLPLFSDSGPTDGLSISIQIIDLSASSLIVHTELIDQATLGSAYKEVLDEYYSK